MNILKFSLNTNIGYSSRILIALILSTTFYAVIWLSSQHKLIYTDEVFFAADFVRIALGQWTSLEIPHPPLYSILGSLSVQVFGYSLPAMRLVGGVGYLLTLWLIPLFCYHLTRDSVQAEQASLIAIVTWAIHPLALQGSLLLDIDNTIFPPVLLLFMIVLSATELTFAWKRIILVGLVVAIMLWVKLLPSNLLIIGLAIIAYIRRKQLFISTLAALIFGLLIYLASFAIFSLSTQFPVELVLSTFIRTQNISQPFGRLLARVVMGGGITTVWIGIPVLIIFGMIVVKRLLDIIKSGQLSIFDILILYIIFGFSIFTIGNELPMGFPRYHYPLALIIIIITSIEIVRMKRFQKLNIFALVLLLIFFIIYFVTIMLDPLLPHYLLTFETNNLVTRLIFGLQNQIYAMIIPLGVALIALWVIYRNKTAFSNVIPSLLISYCVSTWLVTSVTQTQAAYSTIYEYGRFGGWEMAKLVQERTQPTDKIIAPQEIRWAAQRSNGDFVVSLLACQDCIAQSTIEYFHKNKPVAYVLTTKEDKRYTHITRDPQFTALLNRCYSSPISIGTYIAYFSVRENCD